MTPTSVTRDTLNSLIGTCRDGQKFFTAASESVESPVLRAELRQYAMQREDYVRELKDSVLASGEDVDDSGSLGGAVQRGWLSVRQALSTNDRHAVLAECERSEDAAVAAYRAARASAFEPDVAAMIETHYQAILRVHDRVKSLRDAVAD